MHNNQSNVTVGNNTTFKDKALKIFPATSLKTIKRIEKRLKKKDFRDKLKQSLQSLGKATSVGTTVANMMCKILTLETGLLFTFKGRSGKKENFENLNITSVICGKNF